MYLCRYLTLDTDQCPSYIETSQLICSVNQMTGFYMRGALVIKGLKVYYFAKKKHNANTTV